MPHGSVYGKRQFLRHALRSPARSSAAASAAMVATADVAAAAEQATAEEAADPLRHPSSTYRAIRQAALLCYSQGLTIRLMLTLPLLWTQLSMYTRTDAWTQARRELGATSDQRENLCTQANQSRRKQQQQ